MKVSGYKKLIVVGLSHNLISFVSYSFSIISDLCSRLGGGTGYVKPFHVMADTISLGFLWQLFSMVAMGFLKVDFERETVSLMQQFVCCFYFSYG